MHVKAMRIGMFAAMTLAAGTAATAANPVVSLETTHGTIKLELDAEKAPVTVENFLKYVKDGHYNGTIFHRVIPNFMVQGGGMEPGLKEKPTRGPIKNESSNGLKNDKYTVAMARETPPHTATSQFYINVADNGFLNRSESQDGYGYAVFGKVIEGKEVVDKIAAVPTRPRGVHGDVPVEDVVLKKATVVTAK